MKEQFTYHDFDLLIEPGPPGSYRARVLRSPAGESGPVQFMLPFSELELENFVLKVSQGPRRTRGAGRPESAPLKEFGGKLYEAVFQGELRDVLQSSLSRTRVQRAGMRLRLRLADTPELAELPWEFLYDPRHNRFLAQSRRTPLVRYLDLPDPPHPLSVDGPLRLLVMISSPSGYPALDVEQEWIALTRALARQRSEGRVVIERLTANMNMLRRRLRQDEFHVFHFVGHGLFRADWGDGVLVMEDSNGGPREVTGEELGGLLNEYDATRLAVLNACEGARTGVSDPFAGMAQSLIQQGLPAVVAMQFEITDEAAIIFARELYGAMADGFPLEAALAEARGAIRDEGNPTEWGSPVLYSRAPDGHLFDLTERIASAEADREAAPLTQRAPREPDSPELTRMEHRRPGETGTADPISGVVILRLSGMETADAEQAASTLLDLRTGPRDLRNLLVLDDTALLVEHAPVYALLDTAGRVEEMLCVAVGPLPGNGRTLQLPGNLGSTQGAPVLWVSDPAGIDWRVAAAMIANRHLQGKANGLDHLVELLSVKDMFKQVHKTVAEKIPGRLASPGLWLADAEGKAATFAAALAAAIRRLCDPGPGADGPFPALLPEQAGGASLAKDAPLARYRHEVAESVAAASGALEKLGGLGGMLRRGDDEVHAYIIEAGAALTELRDLVTRLLREANATGELTGNQRRLLADAGIRFPPGLQAPSSAPAGAGDQPRVYRATADALQDGDSLALVARRLTLTERELRRRGSASYLQEVDQRCPHSLLDRLAHPPQRLPRRASAEARRELALDDAAQAAEALADLVIVAANREWSATPSSADLSRVRIALDAVRKVLEEYASAAGDIGTAWGARLTRLSESLLPVLRELVLRVVAAELASPSASGQGAFAAARDRAVALLAEWVRSAQANGPTVPPAFASSAVQEVLRAVEGDLTAVREALSYPAAAEMWQLCKPDDLRVLDVTVPPLAVRFAPRIDKEALGGTLPEEPVWTSSGPSAGLVRFVPLRPGVVMVS